MTGESWTSHFSLTTGTPTCTPAPPWAHRWCMRKHVIQLALQAAILIRIGAGPSWGVASSISHCSGMVVIIHLVTLAVLLLLLYIVPLLTVPLPQPLELRSAAVCHTINAVSARHPTGGIITATAAAIRLRPLLCPVPCRGHAVAGSQTNPEGAAIPPAYASIPASTSASARTSAPVPAAAG